MVLRRTRNLAKTAAHTAVIAGTVNAVGGRAGRRQQAEQAQQAAAAAAAAPAQPVVAPVEFPSDDMIGKIERLAALHQSGALTDEEFATLKARALSL